jgi:hypothetical protein
MSNLSSPTLVSPLPHTESRAVERFTLKKYSSSALLAILMVVGGSLLRISWAVTHSPIDFVYSDPERHWFNATHPLDTNPMAGIDPPTYEAWLGLIAHITLGNSVALAVYAALLSLVTPFVWFLFARAVLRDKTSALWFWAVVTWLPSWVGIFSYFMNETLLIPLIGFSLWLTVREGPDTAGRWVGLSLAWAVTCMTRIVALPIAVIAIAFALRKNLQRFRRAAVVVLVSICAFIPPAFRAYQIIRVPTPFGLPYPHHIYWESGKRDIFLHLTRPSDNTAFQYQFGAPSIFNEPLRPFSHYQIRPEGRVDVFINLDRGAADWRAASAEYSPSFRRRIQLYLENGLIFLLGDSWPDGHRDFEWENAAYHFHWMWPLIVLGAVAGSAVLMYRRRTLALIPSLTITSFVVPLLSNAGVMEARFRKPLEGIFILALFWIFEQQRRSLDDAAWHIETNR